MLKRQFGYFIFKRYASARPSIHSNQDENIPPKPNKHVFKKKLFATHAELAKNLVENCIHNENGLIILNKPYGLKKERREEGHKDMQIVRNPSVANIDHLSFTEVLPQLSKKLSVDKLNLVKLPERYISGISILSSNEMATRRISNCVGSHTSQPYTYLALCLGIPKVEENDVKLGITMKIQKITKKAVFVDKYSVNDSKKQKVFPLHVRHRILSVNEELKVSLVEMTINRNKWHCLRLYCATYLFAPCLGDCIMGPRVRYINDMPVLVDPFSPVTNSGPILSDKVLDALQIKSHDLKSIPLHMHLTRLDLERYGKNGQVFIAKPPEHFLWSCQQLGISVPEHYLENSSSSFRESESEESDNVIEL